MKHGTSEALWKFGQTCPRGRLGNLRAAPSTAGGKLRLCELVHKVKEHGYTGMDVVFSKIQEIPPEKV